MEAGDPLYDALCGASYEQVQMATAIYDAVVQALGEAETTTVTVRTLEPDPFDQGFVVILERDEQAVGGKCWQFVGTIRTDEPGGIHFFLACYREAWSRKGTRHG